MRRRAFLASISGAAAADVPEAIRRLQPMTAGVEPVTDSERAARVEKARRLMSANGIGAVFIEPGSSMTYFTGVRWGRSERMFALLLPARGEPVWVVPAFEQDRARELIPASGEVRAWEEDENPAQRVAQALGDRKVGAGKLAIEENTRYFVLDGLRRAAPGVELTGADAVTAGCRMTKSPAELKILTRANQVALEALRVAVGTLREGMAHSALASYCDEAMRSLGCPGEATVTFGKQTAFPHGSTVPQKLRQGDLVLIDAVCTLHGYKADITRTLVFGHATERQRKFWELERKAQDAALAAAKPGRPCDSVDAAARKVLTDAGLGPGYRLPGLPHRTGHGIGLDVHEWPYLVRGNRRPLEAGMCCSDEPMVVVPGEFGIRLEDCFYVTEDGARTFTPQSASIDQPFAG